MATPFGDESIGDLQKLFTLTLTGRIPIINIDELVGLIDNSWVQPDSSDYQLVDKRIEQFEKIAWLRNLKRPAEQPVETDDIDFKRSKSEFKYTNFEKLTSGAMLQQFADWKTDIANLFAVSLSKFERTLQNLL